MLKWAQRHLTTLSVVSREIYDASMLLKYQRIVSIVKPARCTISQIYFILGTTLYMFRTVFPSIIRSLRLYIQHQVYVIQVLCKQPQNVYGMMLYVQS